MRDLDQRPDPDELLRLAQKQEAQQRRGKLKVFLGFAPGVGKTYRMLQVARDLVSDQKRDVVVGVVEAHKRRETAALTLGLELLPRKKIDHRGRTLEELDLDAALARRPEVILVDELAHTNAPGSRHNKRWQDVTELIGAGIDVLTTMNVQHIESYNDVVAQITRVHVRETVPDAVLDDADEIEVVDLAPEELLERLKEGKVYLPAEAERAKDHFFRRGNLLALRELTLRRAAAHVDEDVREYREEHGVSTPWPSSERILVCVGPAPSSGRLIRAGARMAAGLRCPWIAAYVDGAGLRPMRDADRDRTEAHLRLAESLGASTATLSGASVSAALLAYARKHNVTRLIIGKPAHARLLDRLRGSLLDEVVRGSGDVDVHVISGDEGDDAKPRGKQPSTGGAPRSHYLSAAGIIAVTTALAALLRATLNLPDLEMLFLLAVIVVAAWFGRGPSVLAAAMSVACYDFFFVPPFYTFTVSDRRYFLTFAMMFGVGFIMSELTGRLRRQERDARAREERTAVLYALTKELSSAEEPQQIASIAARDAANVFNAQAFMLAMGEGGLHVLCAAPRGAALGDQELGVTKWTFERGEPAGLGTDTLPGARAICAPLRVGPAVLGVIALVPAERAPLGADQRAFLDVFSRQVAVALERARLAEEARRAALRAKTEEMRSSLLSAVSHDLRTPLASITGAATALRDDPRLDEATKAELIEAIVDQAERLERLVANLLDMTRLAAGGVALKKDWVPLDEIIGSALTRLEKKLEQRAVTIDIAAGAPLVLLDPVLFEQLFLNLLENADKYTPPGSPIEITARVTGDHVLIDVADHGPGIPAGAEDRVFEKFFRGPHVSGLGAGLGLPICKGIAEAHGGTITARSRASGGAVFHIDVPSGGAPPSLPSGGEP